MIGYSVLKQSPMHNNCPAVLMTTLYEMYTITACVRFGSHPMEYGV